MSRPISLAEELAALRAEIAPKLARIEQTMNELMVARRSRAKQSRQLGVSRTTLWRRERVARERLEVNGQI